jgi:hypothetical protein
MFIRRPGKIGPPGVQVLPEPRGESPRIFNADEKKAKLDLSREKRTFGKEFRISFVDFLFQFV